MLHQKVEGSRLRDVDIADVRILINIPSKEAYSEPQKGPCKMGKNFECIDFVDPNSGDHPGPLPACHLL